MKIYLIITGLIFFSVSPQYIKAQRMMQKIEQYLTAVYPEKKNLKEGEFQYKINSKISKLSGNEAKICYPHLEFYKTQLQTAYFEFPEVEVLIAVETRNPQNINLLKSLSFESPDPGFLKAFYGCARKSEDEQRQLAHAITTLMATVAVQPEIEALSSGIKNSFIYRISQANGSYIDFNYKFNIDGVLDHISGSGN